MVVSAVVEFLAADNTRIALGIGLLAVLLYYRKALSAGAVLQTWAGRLAFSAAVLGALLLLGVIEGVDVETALGYVEQLVALGGDLLTQLREVVGA